MASSVARSAAKREAIIAAATDLFIERGYDGVSVDAVVRQVGGSKASIYNYFGNKEGLFKAIIENNCQKLLESLQSAEVMNLTPRAALTVLGHQFISVILSPKAVALHQLIVAQSPQFPEMGKMFFEAGPARACEALEKYIKRQQELGKLRKCNTYRAAEQFYSMLYCLNHLRIMLDITPPISDEDAVDLVNDAVDTFMRGHGVRNED
ncbi:TetR/AcrR family transcriptional regulator [Mastigocoleus testarum]|uniref:HTH tetR-type domain-containing protein n=1 Tax=Mastigocoleus testarum BC008 TaxID=371196 RepID=A0A0V7ZTD9_9CYAN|nr:TetR/AcrR family transcriptional regulator [Mastigocoleus testarum]KST67917.1 hypothetical protein BC008_31535 [Mastigocoleus testarum BC008]